MLNILEKDDFGAKRIDKVKLSDAKGWLIKLQNKDGKMGFLSLDKNGMPMVALHWEKYVQHIIAKYNKIYKVQMPKVTPHVCRHTYCSHCASSGMNPEHLQYLIGYSDIGVTFNTYTHVDFENVKKEVKSLEKAVL